MSANLFSQHDSQAEIAGCHARIAALEAQVERLHEWLRNRTGELGSMAVLVAETALERDGVKAEIAKLRAVAEAAQCAKRYLDLLVPESNTGNQARRGLNAALAAWKEKS